MTKIVTIIGSRKFRQEHIEMSKKITLHGFIVLSCMDNLNFNENEWEIVKQLQFAKILKSDIIFVINKNKYIGEFTKKEIEFATKHNKEILYYERL